MATETSYSLLGEGVGSGGGGGGGGGESGTCKESLTWTLYMLSTIRTIDIKVMMISEVQSNLGTLQLAVSTILGNTVTQTDSVHKNTSWRSWLYVYCVLHIWFQACWPGSHSNRSRSGTKSNWGILWGAESPVHLPSGSCCRWHALSGVVLQRF